LEQVGTPAEIYERPRTRFVADFIGVTNFFSGTILGREGQRVWFESGDGLRLFLPASQSAVEGRRATLAVRPEKLRMAETVPEAHVNTCSGTVAEIIYLGPVVQHRVRTASGALITVLRQNDSGDPPRPVGSPVHLWWEPSATHLLED
jgi:ABC-type Fe3+/spermidine/putrescine transport system ATPase subunit